MEKNVKGWAVWNQWLFAHYLRYEGQKDHYKSKFQETYWTNLQKFL